MITNLSRAKFANAATYLLTKLRASRLTGFQRAQEKAKSLAKQRRTLDAMAIYLREGRVAQAQACYAAWKRERAAYLVLADFY